MTEIQNGASAQATLADRLPNGEIKLAKIEPFNPEDPRWISSVEATILPDTRQSDAFHLRHYKVTNLNCAGQALGQPQVISLEFRREQDVIDLCPCAQKDGQWYMFIAQEIRPTLVPRSVLLPDNFLDQRPEIALPQKTGRLWQLPGAFIVSEDGQTNIDAAVQKVLVQKLGLRAIGAPEFNGAAYFSSGGRSTELDFPRSVLVEFPQYSDFVIYGENFYAARRVIAVKPQEVLDGFACGDYQDPRMVLAAIDFARFHGIKLKLPESLTTAFQNLAQSSTLGSLVYPVQDSTTIQELINRGPTDKTKVCDLRYEPCPEPPAQPYQRHIQFLVQNKHDQHGIGEPYIADAVIGPDSVDICAFGFDQTGKVVVGLRLASRVTSLAREEARHPIHTETSVRVLEGVSAALHQAPTQADLEDLVQDRVTQEFGLKQIGQPALAGIYYASPGFNPERIALCFSRVDLTQVIPIRMEPTDSIEHLFVSLEDMILLTDTGVIKCPRVALSAHLLKLAYENRSVEINSINVPHETITRYLDLVNSGSQIEAWLAANSPESFKLLQRQPEFRKLILYVENELGLTMLHFDHPKERFFFSALFALFAIPEKQPEDRFSPIPRGHILDRIIFGLAHDSNHYRDGDMIPFRMTAQGELELDPNGQPIPIEFEEYNAGGSGNENHSVYFSDVQIPKIVGFERARVTFDGPSPGEVLTAVGLDSDEHQAAIQALEGDGYIPEMILRSEHYFEYREVIVGRILMRSVLDPIHLKGRYQDWLNCPEVVKLAVQLLPGRIFGSADQHQRNFDQVVDQSLHYAEGYNGFKAAVAQTINTNLVVTALRITYLAQVLANNLKSEANSERREMLSTKIEGCHEHVAQLVEAFYQLRSIHGAIKDIEMSDESLKMFQSFEALRDGPVKQASYFVESLSTSSEFLTEEQVIEYGQRLFPYLNPFSRDVTPEIWQEVARRERESFERMGLTPPETFQPRTFD